MSRVYVLNNFGNNTRKANKFGQVIEISEEPLNSFSIDRLAWILAPGLAQFQPDDYLLLTGPGSSYIVSGVLLFSRPEISELKCLRFDSRKQQYVPLVIPRPVLRSQETDKPPGRIFLLNYSGHIITSAFDYSPLPQKDKLVILSRGNVNQFDVEALSNRIYYGEGSESGLTEFQKGDMLLLSGPAVAHMLAAAAFVAMDKDISLLLFGPRSQNYLRRDISLADILQTAQMSVEATA